MSDTAKVWLKRVAGVEPVIGLSYIAFDKPDCYSRWEAPADVAEFEVSADIAAAAIETGGFEERPGSKVKMKGDNGGNNHADTA